MNRLSVLLARIFSYSKDLHIKLICLGVALILFAYVQFAENITRTLHIRVNPPIVPPGLILTSKVPSFMDVEFYGPSGQMDFTASEFRMQLINQRPVSGDNQFRVKIVPDLPTGLEASYPRELLVQLDEPLIREVFVEPALKGNRDNIGGIRVRPRTVFVRGPYQRAADLDRISTEPITLTGGGQTVRTSLSDLPEFMSLVDGQPMEVQIEVWDKSSSGQIVDIPVRCLNAIPGLQVRQPPQVRVYLPEATGVIRPDQLRASTVCSVFLHPGTRAIRPSYLSSNLVVEIEDLLRRSDRPVVVDGPWISAMQFEKTDNQIPIPVQQGREEHIFR